MFLRLPEYKWRIFAVTSLSGITTAMAIGSINLALPIIADEFGVSMSTISWLSLVFSLIASCTLLIFGRMGDLFGYKRQFIIGFIVFGVASLLPILPLGVWGLLGVRGLQGVGYSLMVSISQAICNKAFPINERGKALGIGAVFVSIGYATGPSVSGFLMSRFTWRSLFYFNAPLCFLGVILAILILKEDEPLANENHRMDWLGSAFFAIFIGLLALSINFSTNWGVISLRFFGCLAISLAALTAFIYRENSTDIPLMRLEFFRNKVFSHAIVATGCSYFIQQMTTFLMPFFIINILLLSRSDSGLIMLATPLAMLFFSPISGILTDLYGSRLPALTGLFIIAVGNVLMCFLNELSPVIFVVFGLFLFGVGNGLSVSAITASVFSAVPKEHSGMASGMVGTVRNLGQGMGVAFGGVIMTIRQNHYLTSGYAGEAGSMASSVVTAGGNRAFLLAQRDAFCFGLLFITIAFYCMARTPGEKAAS